MKSGVRRRSRGLHENSSGGEGRAGYLGSGVRTETTWDFNQLFSQGPQDILGKSQHERDTSPRPPASLLSTVSACLWFIQGSDPAGHCHPRGQASTRMRTAGLQQRRHVAGPETTVHGGVSAPFLCSGVWRQDWAALDKVLRAPGPIPGE